MATIQGVIDQFCYRSNLPVPSAYVGVASPAERQYLSMFKYIGDKLRNSPYLWPQLKRSHTFTTEDGVSKLQLPGDFYRLLESTQWDLTNQWPLRGPISDFNFAARRFSVVALQTRKSYRIIGPQSYIFATSPYTQRSAGFIEIDPAPDSDTDQLYMEYLSCNWVWPRDWVASTAYTTGDLRTGVNNIYRAGDTDTSGTTRPSHTSGTESDGTVDWTVYAEPYTWSNDADIVLFDEDLMVDGMVWAYLRAKGQPFEDQRIDWEDAVRTAAARHQGAVRINAADEFGEFGEWPNIPPQNWSV